MVRDDPTLDPLAPIMQWLVTTVSDSGKGKRKDYVARRKSSS